MGGVYGKGAGSELAEGGGSITNHLHGIQPTRQRSVLVTVETPPANGDEVILTKKLTRRPPQLFLLPVLVLCSKSEITENARACSCSMAKRCEQTTSKGRKKGR